MLNDLRTQDALATEVYFRRGFVRAPAYGGGFRRGYAPGFRRGGFIRY